MLNGGMHDRHNRIHTLVSHVHARRVSDIAVRHMPSRWSIADQALSTARLRIHIGVAEPAGQRDRHHGQDHEEHCRTRTARRWSSW